MEMNGTSFCLYQQTNRIPKDVVWKGEMSEKKGLTIKNYINDEMLHKYIKVSVSRDKHIFMYLRRYPKIMRTKVAHRIFDDLPICMYCM